ncbi:ABC transporter ATP-binding protein [Thioalkalivibrio sp. HK1]|uniref:ABC transporter ATP-binding protein n=1 Tax=Thioalkalivibrio sp. HK1 TaxID=1469245 RepID=UPI0009DE2724|nr:ABC transporter ATP-binding protein [Thioalkalivibrio sp. HK1]
MSDAASNPSLPDEPDPNRRGFEAAGSAVSGSAIRLVIDRKRFRDPPTLALEGIEFVVDPGEFVVIVGPSGAGKTTLLNIVGGLDRDFEGRLDIGPSALSAGSPQASNVRVSNARASNAKERIGYVFQSPRLMPWLNALDNVQLVRPRGGQADRQEALALLEEAGLGGFEDALPAKLSGGMQRRVAIARAFHARPTLLLMDEPFASLDEPLAWRLRECLHDLWRRYRTTVLFVTHDLTEAISLGDRILFFAPRPGRIVYEQAVDLPHPRGSGDPAVSEMRARLLADHPGLLAGGVGKEASPG